MLIFLFILLHHFSFGQYFPFESKQLSSDLIKLKSIEKAHFNIYILDTILNRENLFLKVPENAPHGYYEAYYNNDTLKLALIYYNYGEGSFLQQFYIDGAMKSDTEYNINGKAHGLHIVYDKEGNEIVHQEYTNGQLYEQYDYHKNWKCNRTAQLNKKNKIAACYYFLSTPSRNRTEYIKLNKDGTCMFYYSINNLSEMYLLTGNWKFVQDHLEITYDKNDYQIQSIKKYILIRPNLFSSIRLVEFKDQYIEWYHSDYNKLKNCRNLDKLTIKQRS